MDIKQIMRALSPLKRRMFINITVGYLVYGFLAAGLISIALSCISLLTPIYWISTKILWIYSAFLSAALIISIFHLPDNIKVLKKADSFGSKERLITAYELRNENSKIAILQRKDALNTVAHLDIKAHYPIRARFEYILLGILFIFLIVGTSFIPSISREKTSIMEAFKNDLAKQAREIDLETNSLNNIENIDKDSLNKINMKLGKFKKELLNSKTQEDAIKALSKVKNELLQFKQGTKNSDLNRISKNFSNNPLTENLADALKKGNISDVKKKIEDLKNKLDKLDAGEQKKISDQFRKASEQVNDSKLKENLSAVSQALASDSNSDMGKPDSKSSDNLTPGSNKTEGNRSDNSSQGKEQLSNLEDSLSQQPENDKKGKDQYDNLIASINDAKNHFSDMQDTAETPMNSQNQEDIQGDKPGESLTDNEAGIKSDKLNLDSNSKVEKEDSNGGGAASLGSSNGDIGNGSGESGKSEIDKSNSNIKDYESVYVPKRLGGDSQESQVKGTKGEAGKSTFTEAQDTKVENGSIQPYDKVWGEYKNEAMNSMQGSSIPEGMKDIVREYFSSLD